MPGIVLGCNDDYLFNELDTAEMRGVASDSNWGSWSGEFTLGNIVLARPTNLA